MTVKEQLSASKQKIVLPNKELVGVEKKEKKTTKIFNAPKNFNKGGRVGLKSGGGSDLGMQSVKHGIDKNPKITAADPKAKFIAKAKNKKSKKKFI
jgi:hypothetical protein